ncbi:Uu.00g117240.m01.CDS01 [Anthostomella pinea]|uniref:Uu.00g117240.m01.CDS01 n=1 Tax=Anthostomella pinea TaxID=933095 RepID=A0AAI8VH53_9PEZI|nr:Uu.00g117240.m01.CDS01 [Anthostomella pinea]
MTSALEPHGGLTHLKERLLESAQAKLDVHAVLNPAPHLAVPVTNAAPVAEQPSIAPATTAASAPRPSSKTRKAHTSLEEDIAAYKQDLNGVVSQLAYQDLPMPSCNVVRGRINKLLDAGIMTNTDFCRAIGSSNTNRLTNFLSKTGANGLGSSVYLNACA